MATNKQLDAYHFARLTVFGREHEFVRQMGYTSGPQRSMSLDKPTITLYDDRQMCDIKRFCYRGNGAVLGVGKTYDLGEFLVTPMVYEDLSVVRRSSNEHPVCLGPVFIHHYSTAWDYEQALRDFKYTLDYDCDDKDDERELTHITLGSNGKQAINEAIEARLPGYTYVLCVKSLKQNTNKYLKSKAHYTQNERDEILTAIFGADGLLENSNNDSFEPMLDNLKNTIREFDNNGRGRKFLAYFETNLLPTLTDHVIEPIRQKKLQRPWTYKECDSANRVLNTDVMWKVHHLTEFIQTLHSVVEDDQEERSRASTGGGIFRQADGFRQ